MNGELPVDRMHQLNAEALESARKWANLAVFHHGRGETREAVRAEQCAENARRYAEILKERADAAQARAKA